jgi:GAF domain-containing protein
VPDAILAVPVASARRTLGVLTLLDRDARRPGADRDIALLALFADQAALALESVQAFSQLGRLLLEALADAAGNDGDLAAAAGRVAAGLRGPDADLAALAGHFAALARQGAAERRLALGVLSEVATYTERRASRTR